MATTDQKVFTAQYAEDGGWRNWLHHAGSRRLVPGPVHPTEDEAKAALDSERNQLAQRATA